MIRFFTLILAIICFAFVIQCNVHSANAQSRDFDCLSKNSSPIQAKETLSNVQNRYIQVQRMRGNFTQESYLASLDVREESEGEIFFNRPGSMRWEYTAPEKQTFLLHQDTIYFYQPEDKQLVVDALREVLISDLPLAFLMGIGSLDKNFNVVSSCKSVAGNIMTLQPRKDSLSGESKNSELMELKLLVKEGDFFPAGARIIDRSGNVTAVVFKNIVVNGPSFDEQFSATFPKGIDVHDRRKEKNE